MFDAHCHIGTPCDQALVCTSSTFEFALLPSYPHRAYGILEPHEEDVEALEAMLAQDPDALVGEIGLDARWSGSPPQLFPKLLEVAIHHTRPFVLHVVRRHEEVLRVIKDMHVKVPFIVHGFTSSREVALRYIRLGGTISLGPASRMTRHYADLLDLPFLLESDMPLGEDSQRVLDRLYRDVASDMGIEKNVLEEVVDGRRTVFTP